MGTVTIAFWQLMLLLHMISEAIEHKDLVANYDPYKLRGYIGILSVKDMIHRGENKRGWVIGPDPRGGQHKPVSEGSEETAVEISRWLYDNMEVGEPLCSLELKEQARTAFTNEEVEDNFEEAFDILIGMEGVKAYAKKLLEKR